MNLTIDKTSGGSNSITTETVIISRSAINYGRTSTPKTTWRVRAGSVSATMVVTEDPYGIYAEANTDISISNDDTSFVISGVSNAYAISVAGENGVMNLTHDDLIVNGEPQYIENITYVITGDPGKNGLYEYSIIFHCSKNDSIVARTASITLSFEGSWLDNDQGSIEKTINVTQAAGSAYVYWSTTSGEETTTGTATMTKEGTPIYTYIMSNTSWTITQG